MRRDAALTAPPCARCIAAQRAMRAAQRPVSACIADYAPHYALPRDTMQRGSGSGLEPRARL